jgi:tRNA threonylcarbamoyladenosine biosynthesis protein TsaB
MSQPIRGLAIETSSRIGSVALAQDGRAVAQETFEHGLQHAARIVPAIDQLCRRLDWKSEELRQVYVSAGPGSFTGLRIGITLAKTLAFVTGAKLVAVPTVRVLVESAPPEARHDVIVIDAKRDQIFTASFDRQGNGWTQREPAHLDSLAAMLARAQRPVHLIGQGIPFHRKFIADSETEIFLADESLWQPHAETVARLGWGMAINGQFIDPLKLSPIYIRRPEAEEKLGLASA